MMKLALMPFDLGRRTADLPHVLRKMERDNVDVVLITKKGTAAVNDVVGLITQREVALMTAHIAVLIG